MKINTNTSSPHHRGGMVAVIINMVLEPGDARYEEHHVFAPTNMENYENWLKQFGDNPLPVVPGDPFHGYPDERAWHDNPFANFALYVDPETPDDEIMDRAEIRAIELYRQWEQRKPFKSRQHPRHLWPSATVTIGMKPSEIKEKIDDLTAGGQINLVICPHTPYMAWLVSADRLPLIDAKKQHLESTPLERRIDMTKAAKRIKA